MEYYENSKGQIAILVSGDYGAGWSTWNKKELAYDKRVVEYWLSKKDDEKFMREVDRGGTQAEKEAKDFMCSIGYPNTYMGGFVDIHIEWIEKGTKFFISEYDGFEALETEESIPFITLI